MPKLPELNCDYSRAFHEVLLSLNLTFVVSFAIMTYNLMEASYSKGTGTAYAFLYYFLRAAVRINDFLHLNSSNPNSLRWPEPLSPFAVGSQLAFAISSISVGLLFLLLLHLLTGTQLSQFILNPVGGLLSLLGFPAVYLYIFTGVRRLQAMDSVWVIAIPEFACMAILFIFYRFRPFSAWVIGVLMFLHYFFWIAVLWNGGVSSIFYFFPSGAIFLIVFPLSGIAWLFYVKSRERASAMTESARGLKKWMLVVSTAALMLLGVLWLPGRDHSLVRLKHPETLTIEMSRTNCQVGCPVYTITIHGNGTAEYLGKEYVRGRGPHSVHVSQEQIGAILADFDRADFFCLEDRAFAWGYHSARVRVKISIDGKTKEVWSDSYSIGSKTGSQAKFVQAAAEIDRIVGSDFWVKCDGGRCPSLR